MGLHKDLTGADLHEPKGADSAAANTLYVANGAGSGTWQKVAAGQVDTSSIFNVNKFYLTVELTDVNSPETVYRAIPFAGTLNTVYTVLQGATTVADATVTVKNDGGSTAATITIATAGSAAGNMTTTSVTTNNTFTAGQKVSVTTDGGGTGPQKLFVTLVFTITG